MVDLIDNAGLICGYIISEDGDVETLGWSDLARAMATKTGTVWLHLNLNDARTITWIEQSGLFPEAAVETLLGSDTHMRLEPIAAGLTGVLGDLHHDFAEDPMAVGTVRLFLDDHRLVTARREPLRAIDSLRRAVAASGVRPTGSANLLAELLNQLSSTLGKVIDELVEAIDLVEDKLLAGEVANEAAELGRVRRLVAQLRRHIVPQRQALSGIVGRMPGWLTAADAIDLRQAAERLGAVGHDLDLVHERAQLMQSELSARLAESTNRNLYFLSIITAIMLPLTLITGIFGMNVKGLPGVEDELGFIWVTVGMIGTLVVTLVFLRWRKLL